VRRRLAVDSGVNLSLPRPTRIWRPASSKPFISARAFLACEGSTNLNAVSDLPVSEKQQGNSLNETISLGATRVHLIALEDDLFKLTKRLKNLLKILLSDTKVNIADVETMERGTVSTRRSTTFRGTSSAILLGFGELGNDGNAFQFLTSQLQCFGYRLFVLELNIADAEDVS
jgi:hypothetical protein